MSRDHVVAVRDSRGEPNTRRVHPVLLGSIADWRRVRIADAAPSRWAGEPGGETRVLPHD